MHIIESMRRVAADIEAKPTLNLSTALESESERVEAESGGYAAGNVYGWIAFAIATQLAPAELDANAVQAVVDVGEAIAWLSDVEGEYARTVMADVIAATDDPGRPASLANM